MNNEQLTKTLVSGLIYGLKIQTKKRVATSQGLPMERAIGTIIGFSQRTECELIFEEDGFAEDFDMKDIKPVLYPMSGLTQEITINGETFVPNIEIGKIRKGYSVKTL